MAGNSRKSRADNQPSQLLNNDENNTLFQLLGNRCNSLASAVVQVYLADPPSCQKWNKRCCGVATFIKDNVKRSYFIRIYDLKAHRCIWEQEIYNQFKYKTPRAYFHTFDTDNCPAGLNFANETEAENFKAAVLEKLQNRQHRRTVKRGDSGAMGGQNRPPPPPGVRTGPAPPPPAVVNHQPPAPSFPTSNIPSSTGTLKTDKKNNKGKKVKISKDDIGTPTDFRHVQHVGWDAEKGAFDVDKLDTDMKDFFGDIGISASQLKDTETATFIYNFIEEHGGIQAIKEERQQRGAGRPPPPVPSMPAPLPPSRGLPSVPPPTSAPPPPSRAPPSRGTAPPPPPAMSRSGGGMAPPPGPPTRGGHPPPVAPPPPPSMNAAAHPPAPMGGPPPPPPPPPPMSGPPPPPGPPPPSGPPRGGNFLDEIQSGGGGTLRHVEQSSSGGNDEPEGGRNALLAAIRTGSNLKPVTSAPADRPKSEPEEDGLAGALMKALKAREAALRPDDDDDDEEVDDDDDWDD